MSAPAHAATRPRVTVGSFAPAAAVVLAVFAVAVAGVVLSIGSLTADSSAPVERFPAPAGQPSGTYEVGGDVPTSFGAVSVQHVERVNGLTSRDLAGMTHGINGLVPEKQSRVQASVTVTNLLDRPFRYSPAAFGLRTSRDGKRYGVGSSTLKPGVLEPDASIDLRVDFTVPRSAKRFWIDFTDPRRSKPLTVDVGSVKELASRRPASAGAQQALLDASGGSSSHGHGGR